MKTKAEQLIEVANWLNCQESEFTKNFPSMHGIIRFYEELPAKYDKKKSVVDFINKNLKGKDCGLKQIAARLALIVNSLFGFRYFQNAPYKWRLDFLLHRWKFNRSERIEVVCLPYDKCDILDKNLKPRVKGECSIKLNTIGDAKSAVYRLLEEVEKNKNYDYEVVFDNSLEEAMKQSISTEEEIEVNYSIPQ